MIFVNCFLISLQNNEMNKSIDVIKTQLLYKKKKIMQFAIHIFFEKQLCFHYSN